MAARVNMSYSRPERHKPTCGTSDPSIMQMMTLPASAMRDIMIHDIMSPLMTWLRAGAGRSGREGRRAWWRGLAGAAVPPVRPRRQKRTVGLYSYAPWLTNDVSIDRVQWADSIVSYVATISTPKSPKNQK